MKYKIILLAVGVFSLSGCNMSPSLYTADANKSSGTVVMAYHYSQSTPMWWSPKFGEEAQRRAELICQGWEYDSARPLDDTSYMKSGSMIEGVDSVTYQCIKSLSGK